MFVKEKNYKNDFLIQLANEKIEIFKDRESSNIVERYYNLIENILCDKYKCKKKQKSMNKEIIDIRRRKAEYLLSIARNGFSSFKVDSYKKVIRVLKLIPNTENQRRKIIKEMEPYQKEFLEGIPEYSNKIDISESIKKLIDQIEGKDLRYILGFYAFNLPFINKNEMEKKVKSSKGYLVSLFQEVLLDKRGKVKYKMPSIFPEYKEEAILANAEREYVYYANVYAQAYIKPILLYVYNNFNVDEGVLNNIIKDNIFIPNNREKIFIKGILAGLKFDFITSLSILIPQVENSLRCIAENCGDVIYQINEEGIEKLITFNGILDLPKINEALDEDLIFNLKCIFTSKFGINMRNDIAHGILDEVEFNSIDAFYTWGIILKLCCMYSPWIRFRQKK